VTYVLPALMIVIGAVLTTLGVHRILTQYEHRGGPGSWMTVVGAILVIFGILNVIFRMTNK
jgi:uncharacterized membrane protein HdeD (DUF308 family)